LKSELEIQLSELEEQWHFWERIFIENKIYRDIEEKTREDVIQAVDDGLNHTLNI
jgi:topoisomerase-4 subunit A